METMNAFHFQAQLTSIMDMLAKSAIVEIGKLVEECCSTLHLEIARHVNENESLRKKCDFLECELRSTRDTGRTVAQKTTVNCHHSRSQFGGGSKGIEERHPPAIDNVFGKEWCMNLWREEERGQQTDPSLDSSIIREESVDLVDEGPDMILIKEETWEDCLGKNNTQSEPVADGRGQMMPSNNISGSASVTQSQTDSFVTYAITSDNQVGQSTQHRGPDSISTATLPTTHGDNTSEPNLDSEEFVRLYPNTINFNPMQNQRSPRGDKKFECVFCGKSFTYLGYLKVHLRQHSGEKPFACTMCGKRFARKTYLKLHQRTHSGEKPYTCMECGKSFSQKSSLNVHLRTHTGEKPFNCVECGKSYTHKHGFNKHQCIS